MSNVEKILIFFSDFQSVICSSPTVYDAYSYQVFLLNFDRFSWTKNGNDERKRIPNQKYAKWPHKHHEMSTKLIHNSTRIPFNIFLKEKNHFSKSLVLAKIISGKTLWKSESAFLPFCPIKFWKLSNFFLMNIVV